MLDVWHLSLTTIACKPAVNKRGFQIKSAIWFSIIKNWGWASGKIIKIVQYTNIKKLQLLDKYNKWQKSITKHCSAAEISSAQKSSPDIRQHVWWVTTLAKVTPPWFQWFYQWKRKLRKIVETFADLEPLAMRILSRMVSVQKYHTNRKLKRASKVLKQKRQSQTCKLPPESEGTFKNIGASISPEYRPNAVTILSAGR